MSTDAIASNITSKQQVDKKDTTNTVAQSKTASKTIFAGMTKAQAESAGMLDMFTKIDGIVDNKQDGVISEDELKTSQKIDAKLQNIYKKVDELLKQYGLNLSDEKAKQIQKGLLKLVSKDNQKEVIAFLNDDNKLETLFESFKGALKACKNQNKLNADDILATTLRINLAVTKGGWETKDIDKWLTQGKTLAEKIDASVEIARKNKNNKLPACLKTGKKYSELNANEKKEALRYYFSDVLGGMIQGAKTDKEKQSKVLLQRQEFSKLLIFCTDEERQELLSAVKNLDKNNQIPGTESWLESFTNDAERQEGIRKGIINGVLNANGGVSNETAGKVTALLTKYADKDTAQVIQTETHEEAKKFLEENKDLLEEIEKKQKENPDSLTADEKKLLALKQRYTDIAEGKIKGASENQTLNDSDKKELLNTMITDVNSLSIGQDVMDRVNKYIKEQEENGNSSSVSILKNSVDNYNNSTSASSSKSEASDTVRSENADNSSMAYVSTPITQNSVETQQNLSVLQLGTDEQKAKIIREQFDKILDEKGKLKPYMPKDFKSFINLLNKAFSLHLIKGSSVEQIICDKLKSAPPSLLLAVFSNANNEFKLFMLTGDKPLLDPKAVPPVDLANLDSEVCDSINYNKNEHRFLTSEEIKLKQRGIHEM